MIAYYLLVFVYRRDAEGAGIFQSAGEAPPRPCAGESPVQGNAPPHYLPAPTFLPGGCQQRWSGSGMRPGWPLWPDGSLSLRCIWDAV